MKEYRLHGRGGQGLATWAEVLARAALLDGRHAQTYQSFGVDRPGAPNYAVTRIDDAPILLRAGNATAPDCVVVLDSTLPALVNVAAGLRPGGEVVAPTGSVAAAAFPLREVDTSGGGPLAARARVVGAAAASGGLTLEALLRAAQESGLDQVREALASGYREVTGRED